MNTDQISLEGAQPSGSRTAAAVQWARLVGRLKTTPRTGWVRRGIINCESVADHSWRVAALSLLLFSDDDDDENETQSIDIGQCMQIAIIHDLAEALTGDIAPGDNVTKQEKRRMEEEAMAQISSSLRRATQDGKTQVATSRAERRLMKLFHEYEERETVESVVVKDLDLLDMIIQADEYEQRAHEQGRDVDLSDFFQGTPVSRFRCESIQAIAQEVHEQRAQRRAGPENHSADSTRDGMKNDLKAALSDKDLEFVAHMAKTSPLPVDSIMQVLQGLRQWERKGS